MIRVAIETSTWVGSVAVARDGELLAEVELGVRSRHASTAVPGLQEALETAGVARAEIGEVVVGAGPGSFTGVRVAGATAKGLAMALDVPLVAYSSLLAAAVSAVVAGDEPDPADGFDAGVPVCALFDARRKEAYAGCWRVGASELAEVVAPMVGSVDEIAAALVRAGAGAEAGAGVLFVGEGLEKHGAGMAAAASAAGLDARLGAPDVWPRASSLLWLAHGHPSVGRVADAAAWEPLYVRGSSAERGIRG
ncbi:MAG: tRNA (adenosine(37)-N6)-threonylcarbamoyltransferase complex dimerization subunit type 1 TsaB [Longimicrobiales bacterium]